jgi:hypothetical protein
MSLCQSILKCVDDAARVRNAGLISDRPGPDRLLLAR